MSKHEPTPAASKLRGWGRRRRLRRWLRRAERLRLRGDHGAAFRYYSQAALDGDSQGQAAVGDQYLAGCGVPANPAAAALWYERAASGGNVGAMVRLARLALDGVGKAGAFDRVDGNRSDLVACHAWAVRAVAAGSTEAKVILASVLLDGPPTMRNAARARTLLGEAASSGNASGCLALAFLLARDAAGADRRELAVLVGKAAAAGLPLARYLEGIVRELDPDGGHGVPTAVDLYRQAAALGIRAARTRLGLRLLQGIGVDRDELAGESLLRQAALAGDPTAAALVGQIYAHGGGLPPNYAEASLWFDRAARAGHREAATALGLMHLTGMGVAADGGEAARWFRLAREPAPQAAQVDPAHLLFPGCAALDLPLDIRAWFDVKAKADDRTASYRLGVCLLRGIGGERDPASAAPLLRCAAAELAPAQFLFGQMLSLGMGLDRDEVEARRWLSQAAASGVADAQALLAEMVLNGRGGAPDEDSARRLFIQAAGQRHTGAMFALGLLYTGQHRTPEDAPRATTLLESAARQGHPHASAALLRYRARQPAGTSSVRVYG